MKQVARPKYVVDPHGFVLRDPATGSIVGRALPVGIVRIEYALALHSNGGLRRYQTHPKEEQAVFMFDYSALVRRGVSLSNPSLSIFTNTVPAVAADADWVKGAVTVLGRSVYATLSGGIDGKDYQLRWSATDSEGNIWPRTTLVLCSPTS
jgi:hypothetical protein